MFCTKCGAEIQPPAKFCPKCGTPIEGAAPAPNPVPVQNPAPGAPNPAPAQNPAPGAAYTAPVQNPAPGPVYTAPAAVPAAPKGKGKVKFGVNTLLGIIGAFMAFIGMFIPFLTASVLGIASQSATYVELMEEGDASFMTLLAFGCLAWIVLFHLIKMPKGSLIGVAGLIFGTAVILMAYADFDIFGTKLSYGVGFWLHVAGILVCIVAAFLKKNRE